MSTAAESRKELLRIARKRNRNFFPTAHWRRTDTRWDAQSHRIATIQATPYQDDLKHKILVTRETRQAQAPAWSAARRPTHFIAWRVAPRAHLRDVVAGMRADATNAGLDKFLSCFVPAERLHMTMAVATLGGTGGKHLDDDLAAMAKAVDASVAEAAAGHVVDPAVAGNGIRSIPLVGGVAAMKFAPTNLRRRLNGPAVLQQNTAPFVGGAHAAGGPIVVRTGGLRTFAEGRVVYVQPSALCAGHARLAAMAKTLRTGLADAGIDVKGNRHDAFSPHVTVAKLTPAFRNAHPGLEAVPTHVFDHARHFDFGSLVVDSLEVCAMKGAGEDGYYQVLHKASMEG